MKKAPSKLLNYLVAIIIGLCCICGIATLAVLTSADITSTPTPASLLPEINISTIVFQTASVAQTQTAQAVPPTSLPTATLAPSLETIPTATIFIFQLQTDVAQPTDYIYSTNTPFSLATQPLQTIQSTLPPQSSACSCSIDYNCPDFSSQTEAQSCFDYCKSQGYGDVHGLDRDDDNLACEDTNY